MVKTGREKYLNIPQASGNPQLLREVFQVIEELHEGLEAEDIKSCLKINSKVLED